MAARFAPRPSTSWTGLPEIRCSSSKVIAAIPIVITSATRMRRMMYPITGFGAARLREPRLLLVDPPVLGPERILRLAEIRLWVAAHLLGDRPDVVVVGEEQRRQRGRLV